MRGLAPWRLPFFACSLRWAADPRQDVVGIAGRTGFRKYCGIKKWKKRPFYPFVALCAHIWYDGAKYPEIQRIKEKTHDCFLSFQF